MLDVSADLPVFLSLLFARTAFRHYAERKSLGYCTFTINAYRYCTATINIDVLQCMYPYNYAIHLCIGDSTKDMAKCCHNTPIW